MKPAFSMVLTPLLEICAFNEYNAPKTQAYIYSRGHLFYHQFGKSKLKQVPIGRIPVPVVLIMNSGSWRPLRV